jgi:hypothetical protein
LNGGAALDAWALHDIRRSVASGLARIGVNLPVIERCLSHISGSFGGIVGVYQRHDFADATLARWDDDPNMNFPKPILINGRKHRRVCEIEAWLNGRALASLDNGKKRKATSPRGERVNGT